MPGGQRRRNWRFEHLGSRLLLERNGAGAILRRYVHGPGDDEPVAWYEGAGTADKRWLHSDERGSIIAVTNGTGAAMAINSYDEYGIPAAGNMGRFGYSERKRCRGHRVRTQAWLTEIGMNYYKARMYSPTLGRFMQTDPIGYGDGINWYNYVGSDPVNFTDPSGLTSIAGGDDIVVRGLGRLRDDGSSNGFGNGDIVVRGARRVRNVGFSNDFGDLITVTGGRTLGAGDEEGAEIVVVGATVRRRVTMNPARLLFRSVFGPDDTGIKDQEAALRDYCSGIDPAQTSADTAGAGQDTSTRGRNRTARAQRAGGRLTIFVALAQFAICTKNGF